MKRWKQALYHAAEMVYESEVIDAQMTDILIGECNFIWRKRNNQRKFAVITPPARLRGRNETK